MFLCTTIFLIKNYAIDNSMIQISVNYLNSCDFSVSFQKNSILPQGNRFCPAQILFVRKHCWCHCMEIEAVVLVSKPYFQNLIKS